ALLLILAVSLIPFDPDEELKIKNARWYFLVLLATLLFTLRNGGLKVTEEMALSGTLVLFYGYLLGLVWFLAEDLLRRIRGTLAENRGDRKSTRLNSSHVKISYAVLCLTKEGA